MNYTFYVLAVFIFASCASEPTIVHNRGNDPQVAINYYKLEKQSIQSEIDRIIKTAHIQKGEITLEWTVDEKGRVITAKVSQDTVNSEELNNLLLTHLKSLTFPKTPMFMTSSVVYTYKFGHQ